MVILPDLRHLAVYPSAEEPARPDVSHLSSFFDILQGRHDGVHGAQPEGPYDMTLPDVFGGLDYRQQGQGAPPSPCTPTWPYPPGASDSGASTSPGVSDAENMAPSAHPPPDPNRDFWRFAPAFTRAG